ncbi:MAG: hypothetical protein ACQKBT_00555, partial [Puniceicoccales bacterium]
GGFPVEPGLYAATFWIKAIDLQPGNHLWVSAVGYDKNGKRSKKVQRSDYLNNRNLPDDEWVECEFFFDIREQDNISQIAPVVVFKTSPSGQAQPVPATTRILIDDLIIVEDQ